MATKLNFPDWFRAEVAGNLGPLEDMSLAKAYKALFPNQAIDRETFRKVLKEGYVPSSVVQKRIRDAISDLKRRPARPHSGIATGFQTRSLVANFYKSNPYYEIQDLPEDRPEVLLKPKMSRGVLLIRCLEDETDGAYHGLDHYAPFLDAAVKDIANRRCDEVTLITQHKLNPGEAEDIVLRHRRVQVATVGEFVARFFDVEMQRRHLQESLLAAGLLNESKVLPIPGRVHQPQSELDDVYGEILQRVASVKAQICVILGQFGSGKTTLFQRASYAMLPAIGTQPQLPLPVIVYGRDITSSEQALERILEAIRTQYGYQLPENLVTSLLRDGQLVVFIDALDEARVLLDYSSVELFIKAVVGLDGFSAKFFISLRRELFASPDMETMVLKDLDRIYLRPLDPTAACKAIEARTGTKLLSGAEIPAELLECTRELAPTPLFLNMVSTVVADSWPRIQAISNSPKRRAAAITHLYKEYTRQWVSRENTKALPRALGLTDDDRIRMCERLAVLSMDPTLESGRVPHAVLREEVKFNYSSELAVDTEEALARFEDFVRDTQLSTFLVREVKSSDYFFSHSSFASYFLARAISKEVQASLSRSNDLGAITLRRNDQLLPVFIYGILSEGHPDVLSLVREKIQTLRNPANKALRLDADRLAVAVHNLLFIYSALARLEGSCESLDLDGLYAPFLRFDDLVSEIESPRPPMPIRLGTANLEHSFAHDGLSIDPSASGRHLEPINYSGSATPIYNKDERLKRVRRILEYCWDCGLLRKDRYSDERGFEWCVIPGGRIRVPEFSVSEDESVRYEKAGANLERRASMECILKGQTEIVVPSFLMMRHPVTNAQFLDFVRLKDQERWLPEYHRIEAKNDYYLGGWRGIAHEIGVSQDPRSWNLAALDTGANTRRWKNAPVVYVTWLAAEAFAVYHGLALPTEGHYSTAGSLFQDDACEPSETLGDCWDHPWGGTELKGYALFAYQANQALIPTFDCTSLEEKGLEEFKKWAKAQPVDAALVPLHLTGGVREWSACAWEQHWPLGTHRQNNCFVSPRNDGLTLVNGRPRRVRFHREVLPYYTVRGGSFQLSADEARISYRAPQGARNCNPDCGFRCVKALIPKEVQSL